MNEPTKLLQIRDATGAWVDVELEEPVQELFDAGPGHVLVQTTLHVYSTVRPREGFAQTHRWGRLPGWPPLAADDCSHPFAVLDERPEDELAKRVSDLRTMPMKPGGPAGSNVDGTGNFGMSRRGWARRFPPFLPTLRAAEGRRGRPGATGSDRVRPGARV